MPQQYTRYLSKILSNDGNRSLISLSINKRTGPELENNVIIDQVPHWFGPFIYISTFLIPNMIAVLVSYPEVYHKVKKCINSTDFDIYSKSTYLHYCVIEHIRLFNTININMQRTANQDMNFGIKKGDQIFILFSSILRDERVFNQPDQFIPERWRKKIKTLCLESDHNCVPVKI